MKYIILKTEQYEVFTYKTNAGDNYFVNPALNEQALNDGTYVD